MQMSRKWRGNNAPVIWRGSKLMCCVFWTGVASTVYHMALFALTLLDWSTLPLVVCRACWGLLRGSIESIGLLSWWCASRYHVGKISTIASSSRGFERGRLRFCASFSNGCVCVMSLHWDRSRKEAVYVVLMCK